MEKIKQELKIGFLSPHIDETHYVEGDGRLGASILKPDGDWSQFLPTTEQQAEKYETYSCVAFGSTNQFETLHKFMYGEEPNYSDRFLANAAEINPPGSDPQKVYETIRKVGLIRQEELPMPDTYDEYKTPRPITDILKDMAKKEFKDIYYADHDWILTGTPDPEKLRQNLKISPLCISVTAWIEENGVYPDKGLPNGHWTTLYKMDDLYYYVYDSYSPFLKKLPINAHRVCYAKRIVFYKSDPTVIPNNFLKILQSMVKLLNDIRNSKLVKTAGEIVAGLFNKRN